MYFTEEVGRISCVLGLYLPAFKSEFPAVFEPVFEKCACCEIGRVEVFEPEAPSIQSVNEFLTHSERPEILTCHRISSESGVVFLLDDEVPTVYWFRTKSCWFDLTEWPHPLFYQHIWPIDEVGIDSRSYGDFMWLAVDVGVVEKPWFPGAILGEADNHTVHGCFAWRFGVPCESAVGEFDPPPIAENGFKKVGDGLALGDGVRGNERPLTLVVVVAVEVEAFGVPAGDVIKIARVVLPQTRFISAFCSAVLSHWPINGGFPKIYTGPAGSPMSSFQSNVKALPW